MKRILATVGFCAMFVGGVGYGQTVSVEKRRADGTLVSSTTYSPSAVIDLGSIADEVARINVFSTNTLVNIPKLQLDVPASRPANSLVSLYLTQGDIFDVLVNQTVVGLDFAGLEVPNEDETRIRFACAVAGDVNGAIRVGQVRRLQALGSMNAEVVAGFPYLPDAVSVGVVSVGKIGAAGSISAGEGAGVVRLLGTGNTLEGPVEVFQGGMLSLEVPNGDLGADPTVVGVSTQDGIETIRVAGAVRTQIQTSDLVNTTLNVVEVDVGSLQGSLDLANVQRSTSQPAIRLRQPSVGTIRVRDFDARIQLDHGLGGTAQQGFIAEGPMRGVFSSGGDMASIRTKTRLMELSSILVSGNVGVIESEDDSMCISGILISGTLGTLRAGASIIPPATSQGTPNLYEVGGGINAIEAGAVYRTVIITPSIGKIETDAALNACISAVPTPGNPDGLTSLPRIDTSELRSLIRAKDVQEWNVIGDFRTFNVLDCADEKVVLDGLETPSVIRVGGRWQGSLQILGAQSLKGQVFVNGRLCESSASDAWSQNAVFQVGATVLSPPFYAPTAPALGGGFLAVAPYGLYESMCTPVDNSTGADRITASSFNREPDDNCAQDEPIALHFYGPVQIWNPFVPAAKVELMVNGVPYSDVSNRVRYRINPSNPRELLLEGKPGFPIPAGQYRVTNSTRVDQALFCTSIPQVNNACVAARAVSAFEYRFELLPDCVAPFCEPEPDPSQCPVLPEYLCDPIDFNNDGSLFDPVDVDAFLSVYSEGPCIPASAICNDVDFNNDGGGTDPCDIDAFLLMMSEGPCTQCGQ